MNLEAIARSLILGGVLLLLAGGALYLLARLGVPRLPGDLAFGGKHWKVYFPIATSLVLSLLLTLLLNLLGRFFK